MVYSYFVLFFSFYSCQSGTDTLVDVGGRKHCDIVPIKESKRSLAYKQLWPGTNAQTASRRAGSGGVADSSRLRAGFLTLLSV